MDDRPENSVGVGIAKKSRSLVIKNAYCNLNSHLPSKRKVGSVVGVDDKNQVRKKSRIDLFTVDINSVDRNANKSQEEVDNGCLSASSHESKSGSSEEHHSSNGFSRILKDLSDVAAIIPRRKRDFVGRRKGRVAAVKTEEEVDNIGVPDRLMSSDDGERAESSKDPPKEKSNDGGSGDSENCVRSSENCCSPKTDTSAFSIENGDSHMKIADDDRLEENLTCSLAGTSFRKRSRKRKAIPAVSSFSGLERVREEDEENLEENAAMMLSSRFDPSCTGFLNGNTHPRAGISRKLSSGKRIVRSSTPFRLRHKILRQKIEEKGSRIKVRRNYYRIFGEMDPFWAMNRRIKVFWPLDKSWYSGHVDNYDEESKLHHVKYDDRDEEWIDLQNERFKLLLLPSEVPRRPKRKPRVSSKNINKESNKQKLADKRKKGVASGSNCMVNDADTEPIISWLSRSASNASSQFHTSKKKTKRRHLSPVSTAPSEEAVDSDNSYERESFYGDKTQSIYDDDFSPSGSYGDGKKLLVYYRKRFRKAKDFVHHMPKTTIGALLETEADDLSQSSYNGITGCNTISSDEFRLKLVGRWNSELWMFKSSSGMVELNVIFMESGNLRLQLCFSALSTFDHLAVIENLRLPYNGVLLNGVLVTLWPSVRMEILLEDNVLGSKCVLLEGTLQQVIPLVFYILGAFDSESKMYSNTIPLASIQFKFSSVEDFRSYIVFALNFCIAVEPSKWLYIEAEIRKHCSFSCETTRSELVSCNLKALSGENIEESAAEDANQSCDRLNDCNKIMNDNSISQTCDVGEGIGNSNNPLSFGKLEHDVAHNTLVERHGISSISDNGSAETILAPPMTSSYSLDEPSFVNHHPVVEFEQSNLPQKPLGDSKMANGTSKCDKSMSVSIASSENSHMYVDRLDVDNQSFELPWNVNGGIVPSPNPTSRRNTWLRNTKNSASSGYLYHGWSDAGGDFLRKDFGSGPKKPRTQVSYTLPFGSFDYSLRNRNHQRGFPHKRIRTPNDRRLQDESRDLERNLEPMCCDVNVLVTHIDRGWRECGAQVVLELFDNNEWKLAVKISGISKYLYKAHQFLQPGTTNRYTHSMMWKGGKEWVLEFTNRTQWTLFKEMYEECYHRNIRAASVKNIPIPGVSLIDEHDENGNEVQFFRSFKYFRQIETDVDMALNRSRVLYDMESDDEEWLAHNKSILDLKNLSEITEDMFEKVMDRFEKVAYSQQCDHFTADELVDLMADLGPIAVIREIYDHWHRKRQRKGMPLIRHLQPPLWEKYEQQVKEWELTLTKSSSSFLNGRHDKLSSAEKPLMFAFCLKPRGLELPNKGSKHRSHRKVSVTGQNNFLVGDHDAFHSTGRRLNGFAFGEDRYTYESLEETTLPQLCPSLASPHDSSARGFSVIGDRFEQSHVNKLQRSKPKKIISVNEGQMMSTFQRMMDYRNGHHFHEMDCYEFANPRGYPDGSKLEGSDPEEVKLRNASGTAQYAINLAKLKRERAQRLLYRADLAIHKAVVALMSAEAMKTSVEKVNTTG